jgi:hypothetical protein
MHFDRTVSDDSLRIPRPEIRDSTWLPAALLATLVLLVSALQSFGGEGTQLEWRPAFAPAKKKLAIGHPPARRVVAPQQHSRGYAVVQVAYEEQGGWSSTASGPAMPSGAARMDTLVVHPRDPQFAGTGPAHRIAQDPFENDALDEELSRGINQPFGTNDVPEELPELGAGELPQAVEPEFPDDIVDDMTDDMPDDMTDDELDDQGPRFEDDPLDDDDLFDDQEDVRTQPGGTGSPRLDRNQPPLRDERDRRDTTSSGPTDMAKYERERQRAAENCEAELARARADRITSIDLAIRVDGKEGWDYPFECSIDDGSLYAGRQWPEVTYMWKAAANCHKPLYFEQHQLERYGHSWGPCLQPIVSGAHFFTRLPVLPYCMGITPPNECIYPLGYYRPGNCAPYMVDPIPFTWRAALFQAGATVGTAAILP